MMNQNLQIVRMHLPFIDFNKAFDSVYDDKIWEALNAQGVLLVVIKIRKKSTKSLK